MKDSDQILMKEKDNMEEQSPADKKIHQLYRRPVRFINR